MLFTVSNKEGFVLNGISFFFVFFFDLENELIKILTGIDVWTFRGVFPYLSFFLNSVLFITWYNSQGFRLPKYLKHSQRVMDCVLNRNRSRIERISLTLLHTFVYEFVSSFRLFSIFWSFCILFCVFLFWNKHYEYIYDAVTQLLTSCNNKEKQRNGRKRERENKFDLEFSMSVILSWWTRSQASDRRNFTFIFFFFAFSQKFQMVLFILILVGRAGVRRVTNTIRIRIHINTKKI